MIAGVLNVNANSPTHTVRQVPPHLLPRPCAGCRRQHCTPKSSQRKHPTYLSRHPSTLRPPPNVEFVQGQLRCSPAAPSDVLLSSRLFFQRLSWYPTRRQQAPSRRQRSQIHFRYRFHPSLCSTVLFKQAIEVRAGQQGVKAKWVRIELRKVEVLPGGGQVGTFFDYVGQSPINLWTGPDGEYGILRPVRLGFFFVFYLAQFPQ